MAIKVLYTAHATAVGGRNGHTQSADGLVSVDLSIPKAMGGPGRPNTTTPEDLIAAGYAACFGSACEFVSRQMKLHPSSITVNSEVSIGEASGGGFGLSVALVAQIAGVAGDGAGPPSGGAFQPRPGGDEPGGLGVRQQ
jgi:lipoyl-dependent peroxiredoxin